MGKTPRSQRAQIWAWLYVQLFGTPGNDDDDTSEEAREAVQRTSEETTDEMSK